MDYKSFKRLEPGRVAKARLLQTQAELLAMIDALLGMQTGELQPLLQAYYQVYDVIVAINGWISSTGAWSVPEDADAQMSQAQARLEFLTTFAQGSEIRAGVVRQAITGLVWNLSARSPG